MRNVTILVLLAVLMAACGAFNSGPEEGPTLAPRAEAGSDLEAEVSTGESVTRCTEVDPHPLGVSIAEKYDVSYERVMTWFCSGHTFDEILIALQTSGMADRSPEELLAMRQNQSWDQIWTDLGIVGP